MQTSHPFLKVGLAAVALVLAGCSKSAPDAAAVAAAAKPEAAASETAKPAEAAKPADTFPGMEADLQRTLKEQSDFYHFKTPADLANDTKGLTWEDVSEQAEFTDPNAKKGGTLHEYLPDFPPTLRDLGPNSNSGFREYILDYTALVLVAPHPNFPGKYMPQIATSWALDRSTKTVYFRLDPNAKWSDGEPCTTDDVVFSWYFYRSKYLDDPWNNDFYTKTYHGLTVYDAHTFSITMQELKPDIVDRAGNVSLFPKHFFGEFGPGWEAKYDWRVCPTLGAYTIRDEDVKRTTSISFSRVKGWWGEERRFMKNRFNPDRIHFEVIRDPDKAFEAFVHGDLDTFSISVQMNHTKLPDDHPSITSGFTVKSKFFHQIPEPNFGLWLNEAMPGLDNQDVRIGIAYASNMDLVCKQYFRGEAVIQKSESDGFGFDPNPKQFPRPFDPVKAREYFAKAGYTKQGEDGVLLNAQGRRLAFTVSTVYKRYEDVLVILKQEALKAGLEFDIEVLDMTTGFEKMVQKKHEIALMAFSRTPEMYPRYWEYTSGVNAYDVPYLPDGSPNPARKVKTNTNNLSDIADYQLDQLITAYDKAEDMETVKTLAAKIEQRLYDNAGWVNGFKIPFDRVAYRPWIKWPKD
ncbi:MAG TPA: ABC transporter substrate-binding protein, partial [Opitutaceae bacterium]|nr:ABC transporter substrate-binding protein [Opitutaceae bacterium]